jgi:hypothetical protein
MNHQQIIQKAKPIILWFALYVVIALCFGLIYFGIYKLIPTSFSISNHTYNQALIKYENIKSVLFESESSLMSIIAKNNMKKREVFKGSIKIGDHLSDETLHLYRIVRNWGKLIEKNKGIPEDSKDLLFKNIEHYMLTVKRLMEQWGEINKLGAVNQFNAFRNKGNLADFIYFSIATITTLGDGNIAPNKTIVRVFIVIQLLVSLYLTLIVIKYVRYS